MTTEAIDLLHGCEAIAAFLNIGKRQMMHMHEHGRLPTFKMGRTVCATRSGLADHFRKLQEAANGERI